MHPSILFEQCNIVPNVEYGYLTCDNELKEELKNTHPKNFIRNNIVLPIYKITMHYLTENNNYRKSYKYCVFDPTTDDDEFSDFIINMVLEDYNRNNPKHKMNHIEIDCVEKICSAVLQIG